MLIVVVAFLMCKFMGLQMGVFWAIVTGLLAGIIIGKATEYFTAAEYKPTQKVADAANTGPATVVISGIAEGMLSTWIPITVVGVAMLVAFSVCQGWENLTFGLYGVGIAAVGMLSTLGITLATDAYGPIADNAGGNAEMSGLDPEVRKRTDALDSLGNTTAATGKGFAIGSAALTALALLAAYVEEVRVGVHREVAAITTTEATVDLKDADGNIVPGVKLVQPVHGKAGLVLTDDEGHWKGVELTLSLLEVPGSQKAIDLKQLAVDGKSRDFVVNQIGEAWEKRQDLWAMFGVPALKIGDEVDTGLMGGVKKLETAEDVEDTTLGQFRKSKAAFGAYVTHYDVNPMNPKFLVGVFFGVLLVFVFSAMTMQAVGRAAMSMVQEVRRQFREIAGIMEGTGKPDYARCVEISTRGAQREMVLPSLLALVVPIAIGLLLGVAGVMGLLVGGLCCGFAMAVFMANAGGAWDNAKKYIETGAHGGKGSDAHKAAITGDTIGDPFKDTSGPSLNILIKLMSMVSVVFAGLIVKGAPYIAKLLGIGG